MIERNAGTGRMHLKRTAPQHGQETQVRKALKIIPTYFNASGFVEGCKVWLEVLVRLSMNFAHAMALQEAEIRK